MITKLACKRQSSIILTCKLLIACTLIFCQLALSKDFHHKNYLFDGQWKFHTTQFGSENYYLPSVDDSNWETIKVPSNWYLQGYEHSGVAWYRQNFSLPKSFKKHYIQLVFEGVDYTTDVWINGQYIGHHQGYFQSFSFDISDYVIAGQDNLIAIKVNSPEEKSHAWSLHKELIKGIFSHHDTRPGGAWSLRGQEKNTGGIWAPVYLKVSKQSAITRHKLNSRVNLNAREASVSTQLSINSHRDYEPHLEITVKPLDSLDNHKRTFKKDIQLEKGLNHLDFEFQLNNIKLWWPYELGQANLYQVDIKLFNRKNLLDSISETIGFRTIKRDSKSGQWFINGKRLFLRGTNYIATQWLSEFNAERYAYDIQLMKQANINAVRVHAHILSKEFYQQADKQGLLVWQDFPLQWGYSEAEQFSNEAIRQTQDMVDQLYHYSSIFTWSMQNEPPFDADWMTYKYPNYQEEQNRQLNHRLFEYAKQADQSRYVHAFSATSEHPWLGWYAGHWKDYGKPTPYNLITEFGAQALPEIDSLRRFLSEDELWPDTEQEWQKWDYHNFQKRETFDNAKIKKGKNIHEFINNSQQYQAKLTQYAAEAYRRQKYQPVAGIFQFMFTENWPSINWGIIDYWRKPKPGYYALKKAYQPVLPSIEARKDKYKQKESVYLNLWIINDLHQSFPQSTIEYTLRHNGKIVEQSKLTHDISADSAVKFYEWQKRRLSVGEYEFQIRIEQSNRQTLGLNAYTFSVTP